MSNELKQVLRELGEIRELLGERYARRDDLVTAGYIARRTGLSERTITEGKAGTNSIPRVSLKSDNAKRALIRFPRYAADKWIAERVREAVDDSTGGRVRLQLVKISRKRKRA